MREIEAQKKKVQKKKDRLITWGAVVAALLVVGLLWFGFSAITGGSIRLSDDKVEIPNLVGMDIEKARNQYRDYSIVLVDEKKSDKKDGTILEQTPKGNEEVFASENMVIQVVVSVGKESVEVPDYVEMKSDKAQTKVKKDGFQVNVEERYSDSAEEGVVFAQEPVAGTTVSEGTLVTLFVSKGEKEEDPEDVGSTEEPGSTEDPQGSTEPDKPVQNQGEGNGTTTSTPSGGVTAPGIGD